MVLIENQIPQLLTKNSGFRTKGSPSWINILAGDVGISLWNSPCLARTYSAKITPTFQRKHICHKWSVWLKRNFNCHLLQLLFRLESSEEPFLYQTTGHIFGETKKKSSDRVYKFRSFFFADIPISFGATCWHQYWKFVWPGRPVLW